MIAAIPIIEDLGEDDVTIDGDVETVGAIIAPGAVPSIDSPEQEPKANGVVSRQTC